MAHETFPNLFYALLLQDLPESLALTLAVFSLLNLKLYDKRVLWIALLMTLINLVRLLPIAFGMHSVILIISLGILISVFTGIKLSRVFIAVLICFAVIATAESIYVEPLIKLTGLKYEVVFNNPFLRSAFALPDLVIILLIAFCKNFYNKKKGLIMNC